MELPERRSSPRLAVELPATVEVEGAARDAIVRDVSAVGAQLETSVELGEARKAEVVLRIPETAQLPGLEVVGRVMYSRLRYGRVRSGIQFTELDAAGHRAVHALLQAVLGLPGGGDRSHPRLHHRHTLVCRSKEEVRAHLNDISRGGLSVISEGTLTVGDLITTSLVVGSLRPLELPGRVVRVSGSKIGIELSTLSPETDALLQKLMTALLTPGD
jgi:hypothetical protein